MTDLLDKAEAWAAGDPDPVTRAEVERLVETGDLEALDPLFASVLTFGTAGIRGRVGPGPARMNRAVVIRTTYGLARYLLERGGGMVVVGYDARPDSERFAMDAAGVLSSAGLRVIRFNKPTPTPLVAFAAKHLGAAAAIVVTASHNPPEDNGYKVYGSNAAQIIPPVDEDISAHIEKAPPAAEIPAAIDESLVEGAPSDIVTVYMAAVADVRPVKIGSELKIVYTALHGCGGETLTRLLYDAGHRGLIPVAEQFQPDGRFPTVSFPNPEEKGALDLAISAASRADADLIIANDPDADRLAAAIPWVGEWRTLTGNEIGAVLGDFVMRHWRADGRPIVVSSIVSSPMLSILATYYGARHESTLTGFKWIVNAGLALEEAGEGTFAYGYEEALGYTIGQVVRDKDGMSAALVFCDLVESLRREGLSIWDRIAELWTIAGVWSSGQHSIVRTGTEGADEIAGMVDRLASNPPSHVGDLEVTELTDYRSGGAGRPPWLGAQDLIELSFGDHGRALARPSGTEPKLKVYVDLTVPAGDEPMSQQALLSDRAAKVAAALASQMAP